MTRLTPRVGVTGRFAIAAALGALTVGLLAMFAVDRYATAALRARVEASDRDLAERIAVGFDDQILRGIAALKREGQAEDLLTLDRARATPALAAALRAPSDYAVLTLHDRMGRAIASAAAGSLADPSRLPTRRDVVDRVRADGSAISVASGRVPTMEIAVAVESPPGTVVGVLIAEMSLEVVGNTIASFRVGRDGSASLLDQQGATLVHRDRGRVVRSHHVEITPSVASSAAFTRIDRQDGQEFIVSVAPTKVFPGAVALERSIADATGPVSGGRRNLTLIVLISVAATAVAISMAARRVLAPLKPLAAAVADLGSGDASARAPEPKRGDEIGLLSVQFNRMANALEERMTDLRGTNHRLADAQQRLDDAFTNAPIGMAMLSLDGRLQRVNQALLDLLGYAEDAVLGGTFEDVAHPSDVGRGGPPGGADPGDAGSVSGIEMRLLRADEATVWVVMNISIVSDAEGAPVQLFAQIQDITDRKAIEEELRRVDRAKSEFVANAAHELRTPLTAVSGFAELLNHRDTMSAEDVAAVCAGLQRQGTRARILVERMLDLLRIESGTIATTLQPLPVDAVVRSALALAPAPDDRTVEIALDPDLVVVADDVALEQVVSNLLTNAYRYGGRAIAIRGSQSNGLVRIMIEDDGPGVSPTTAAHLFEPFNRGRDVMGPGSGLGLAIVRKLMASMEGTIRYEAREPNGARFVLDLRGHRGQGPRG